MGDRVAVMRKGELQQVAPPQELYDRPVNMFVGRLHRQPGDEHARGAHRAANGGLAAVLGRDARWSSTTATLSRRRALERLRGT